MGLSVRCPLPALPLSGGAKAPDEEEDLRSALDTIALTEAKPSGSTRSLTGREFLLGSSFQLAAGSEAGVPAWTAWGRFATAGFEADVDEVRMDGDVTIGFLGADVARVRWLAGVLARAFELPLLGRLARMEDVRAHAGSAVGKPRAGSGRPRTTPCFWPRWRRSSRSARSGIVMYGRPRCCKGKTDLNRR